MARGRIRSCRRCQNGYFEQIRLEVPCDVCGVRFATGEQLSAHLLSDEHAARLAEKLAERRRDAMLGTAIVCPACGGHNVPEYSTCCVCGTFRQTAAVASTQAAAAAVHKGATGGGLAGGLQALGLSQFLLPLLAVGVAADGTNMSEHQLRAAGMPEQDRQRLRGRQK